MESPPERPTRSITCLQQGASAQRRPPQAGRASRSSRSISGGARRRPGWLPGPRPGAAPRHRSRRERGRCAVDRVKSLAPEHPEWSDRQPFKGVLEGDLEAVAATGERGLLELVMATHAGLTTDEFAATAREWLGSARHPKLNRLYTECVYQPMLEVLDYLRANGFPTWIVSGGGVEFMRPWTEEVYGVPPEQVVGSSIRTSRVSSRCRSARGRSGSTTARRRGPARPGSGPSGGSRGGPPASAPPGGRRSPRCRW